VTAGVWRVCTGRASFGRSESPPASRKACGICAGPARWLSRSVDVPASTFPRFCWLTTRSTATGPPGPSATNPGWRQAGRGQRRAGCLLVLPRRARVRDATLEAIGAGLTPYLSDPLFAEPLHRLGAYRGIDHLGALSVLREVCDFARFGHAGAFMGFCGLVASEYSSGASVSRGHITHTGNVACAQSSSSRPGPRSTHHASEQLSDGVRKASTRKRSSVGKLKRSLQRPLDCSSLLLSASDGSVGASC